MDSEPINSVASPSPSAFLFMLVGLVIFVILIAGFLIMKYRRELRILNSELAFVTYISRKESSDRFDNPLYSYQVTATDCKPPLPPSPQSPPPPPPQASCSTPTKAAGLFSGFKRSFENNSLKSSHQPLPNEKSALPTDFLKTTCNPISHYEDLKTTKREYNTNIYEDNDSCGPRLSSSLSTTSTAAKEPVYAEIPGAEMIPTESEDDELRESLYDSPRPVSPNSK